MRAKYSAQIVTSSFNLVSHLLPAKVALEHSDANTSLHVKSRLVSQSEESLRAKIEKEDPFDPIGGRSTAEALLRSISSALCKLLWKKSKPED